MPGCHALPLGRAAAARDPRRLLGRLRALVLGVAIATLIVVGEHWLLVEAPGVGLEMGLALQAADAIGGAAVERAGGD